MNGKKKIVIVGAGFGGITAALMLARNRGTLRHEYEILLVDRHHHHLYTPALYEIASLPRDVANDNVLETSVLIPISSITNRYAITTVCDEFLSTDRAAHTITLKAKGTMPFAFCILALGSETNYFDIPGMKEYSFPLKTVHDAIVLRNAIENATSKKSSLHIVVGGAGASGVEIVAEFVNFICALQRTAAIASACNVHFTLVEASPDILPGFEPHIVHVARKRLLTLGITIRTGSPIDTVETTTLMLKNGEVIPYDILIWTGGTHGPSIFKQMDIPLSAKGSIRTNTYLGIEGGDDTLYAIGDNSHFENPETHQPVIWNIPVAESEGRLVARNILRTILGKQKIPFRPFKKYPFILAVGKKYAIADLIIFRFCGFFGWLTKQFVELRYLVYILPVGHALHRWFHNINMYRHND